MRGSGGIPSRDPKAPIALALACALWGSAFLFAKVAFEELGPGHVLLYRFVLTAALLVPVVAHGRVVPRRRDWPLFVLTGFLCVPATMLIQFEGLARTSVTSASLLIGTGTPLLAMAALVVERERLGRRGWVAVLVSCVGILVMVGRPGEGGAWIGDLLVFLSMVVATAWILLSRRIVRRYAPAVASAWILIIGTVTLIPLVLLREGTPPIALSHRAWGSLFVLAVACTVAAFLLWNWAVDRVSAGRAAPFLNLEPVVGAALGVAILGDPLGLATVMGGTLILAAAGLASLPEGDPRPAPKPPTPVLRRRPIARELTEPLS
jgi:drug/metabolite transporter (DMT)-like permease